MVWYWRVRHCEGSCIATQSSLFPKYYHNQTAAPTGLQNHNPSSFHKGLLQPYFRTHHTWRCDSREWSRTVRSRPPRLRGERLGNRCTMWQKPLPPILPTGLSNMLFSSLFSCLIVVSYCECGAWCSLDCEPTGRHWLESQPHREFNTALVRIAKSAFALYRREVEQIVGQHFQVQAPQSVLLDKGQRHFVGKRQAT